MSGALSPYADTDAPADSGTFGDLGRNLWAGTLSLGGSLARAGEYATGSQRLGVVAEEAGKEANYQVGQMSPAGQRNLQAEFLPGGDGPSAYDHGIGGFLSAVAAQAVNSLPSLAASAIPGTLVARGIMAAGGGMAAATAGAGAVAGPVAGTLSAGSIFGAIADEIGRTPDDQLRESSQVYAAMRSQGMEEDEAKRSLIRQGAGLKPLLGGVLSAAAGALLEGHAIARVATQGRALGALRGAGIGARAEAGEEAIQSGVEDLGGQAGLQDALGRPLDPMQVARAVVQGAVVGGAMGGAMGGAGGLLRPVEPGQGRGRRPAIDPLDGIIDPDQRAAAAAVGRAGIILNPPQADFTVDAQGNATPRPGEPAPAATPGVAGLLPAPGEANSDIAAQTAGISPVGAVVATERANTRAAARVGEEVPPVSPLVTARAAGRGAADQPALPNPYGLILTPDVVAGILKRNFDAANPLQGVEPLSPVQQAIFAGRSNRAPAINEELPSAPPSPTVPATGTAAGSLAAATPPTVAGVVPSSPAVAASASETVPTAPAPSAPPGAAAPSLPVTPAATALPPAAQPPATPAPAKAAAPAAASAAPTAPADGSLEAAVAKLPEADRALVAQVPARVAATFWKASKGNSEAFMEKVRRSRGVPQPAAAPAAKLPEAAPATPPATPAVAPAKPALSPFQQGARDQIENRIAGALRTAGTKQQFNDAAIEAILADLDEELRAAKGGASEIAKRLLPQSDDELKQHLRAKVALIEQEEQAKDAATPAGDEPAERKEKTAKKAQKDAAKEDGKERITKQAVLDAVQGGADALEKLARVMGRLARDNFITQAVNLHDALQAAGQEPWPALKAAVAHKASGAKGGNVEARAARAAEWDRIQAEVAKGAQAVAAPAREAQAKKETAADRAFDADAPKTKLDQTPGGLKGRVNRMVMRIRQEAGGKLTLPKKDEIGASPKALWIRAVLDAIERKASPAILTDLLADEHALRAGDASLLRERRKVEGDTQSAKRTSIETAGVAASEEGRESAERGHRDYTGEGSYGREGNFGGEGVTLRVNDDGTAEFRHVDDGLMHEVDKEDVHTARDALARIKPRNIGERMVISLLSKLVGDVKIVRAEGALLAGLSGGHQMAGVFLTASEAAAKQGSVGVVAMNSDLDEDMYNETLIHELIHAATTAKLDADHMLRARLDALRGPLEQLLKQDDSLTRRQRAEYEYYLSMPEELLAGVFSDPGFQDWLNQHQMSAKSWQTLFGDTTSSDQRTWWGALVRFVQMALGLPSKAYSTLEAAMRLGHEAMLDEAEGAKIYARPLRGMESDAHGRTGQRGDRFQEWFGDSKVVDAAGKPLKVYHTTRGGTWPLDEFDTKALGAHLGSHFGTTEAANERADHIGAGARPAVMPVYLKIENPLRLPDLGTWKPGRVLDTLLDKGIIDHKEWKAAHDATVVQRRDPINVIPQLIQAKGYDGIVYSNTVEGGGDSYIVFEPTQIKSAVSNTGDYSATDPRIFARTLTGAAPRLLESLRPGLKGAGDKLRNATLGAMTARNIEEVYAGRFAWTDKTRAKAKADNPLTQAVQATLQRATTARDHRQKADPVIRQLSALEKQEPAAYAALVSLANDATVAGVHPDVPLSDPKNKHVSKTRIGDRQRRTAHAALASRWAKLTPEAQAAYHQMVALFEDYHADVSKMLITNIVEVLHFMQVERDRREGKPEPARPDFAAMAERFLARKETEADKAAVGEKGLAQIKEARNLARVKGPYVPQRRFGDYVVEWEEPVTAAQSFTDEAAANAFIDKQALPVSVSVKAFDAEGREIKAKKNPDPNEPNPVIARSEFTVTVQNKGLAFFDTRGEADAYRAELRRQGVSNVGAVDLREKSEARRTDLLPGQLRELMKAAERNPDLSEAQRNSLLNAIDDAALRLLPGTSVKAGWLRRRNVKGASQDLTRVAANYANAAANFMAKLEHAPQIDAGLSAMAENIRETSREDSQDETVAKRQVLRELQARADLSALDSLGGGSANPWIRRMQSFSFVYYLASPAYTAINLMQPWMTGLPWLGARYGAGASAKAMREAADVVGGLGVLKAGLRETAQSLREALGKGDEPRIDFLGVVLKHIQDSDIGDKRELVTMLQRMAAEGLIDLTAGMELGRAMDAKKSWAGNKAQQVEDMARAMPAAAEVLNRTMLAVAAYRLESAKGGTPEAAFKAAESAVANTQFDYTAANSARYMDPRRHPLLAPAMTFRKFAQGTYFLLVRQAYLAVKGATPEERKVAGRTLAGVLASHLLMAGALGLPLEPIRIALGLAAFLFGADEPWDYETEVRQALSDMFGKEAAEVMARGLPRMLGADLSGRVGLDSLLFLKDLRDFKPETLAQYMGEFLVGAPGAALTNAARAPGLIADGDFSGAAGAVLPKGLRDIIKAARLADSGVVTRRGERIDGNVPLGVDEAVLQALGIQPARVQEAYDQRSAVKGAERRLNTARTELLREYRQAEPAERGAVWARIRDWNRGVPAEARITFENARSALRESERRARESKGETYVPRNRRFLLEEGRFANTRSAN